MVLSGMQRQSLESQLSGVRLLRTLVTQFYFGHIIHA